MAAYRLVRVRNRTRGTVVAERCRVAANPVRRIFGLHLLPRLAAGEGLLLPGASSIDMMFMRYAIDAVFLDGDSRVVRIVADLKPWRMVWWVRGARDCLELPSGAAAASATHVGDELQMVATEALPERR